MVFETCMELQVAIQNTRKPLGYAKGIFHRELPVLRLEAQLRTPAF